MSEQKKPLAFQTFASVRVVDDELERHGHVGTVVGYGEEDDTIAVKFDTPEGTITEDFTVEQLEGL